MLYLDLDGFKHVNDVLGHHAGDHVLPAVARRLRSCVDDGATVARLGGDEFAIVWPGEREGPGGRPRPTGSCWEITSPSTSSVTAR